MGQNDRIPFPDSCNYDTPTPMDEGRSGLQKAKRGILDSGLFGVWSCYWVVPLVRSSLVWNPVEWRKWSVGMAGGKKKKG